MQRPDQELATQRPFRYHITLRLACNSTSFSEIASKIALVPHSVKQQKPLDLPPDAPPKFADMGKANRVSFRFEPTRLSEDINSCLERLVAHLRERKAFLQEVQEVGGSASVTIMMHLGPTLPNPLDWSHLEAIRRLRVTVSLELGNRLSTTRPTPPKPQG